MTVKIEVDEVLDRLLRSGRGHLAGPHETPESLHDFDIRKVRRMELGTVAEEASLDSGANRGLEEKLQ
jgi:hypothetical protein